MSIWLWTLGSVITVSLVSFVGLLFLSRGRAFLDSLLMYLVSLAAGALLGGALFHLLPRAFEIHGDSVALPLYVAVGFLGFFLLERFLWAHHHGHGDEPLPGRDPTVELTEEPLVPGFGDVDPGREEPAGPAELAKQRPDASDDPSEWERGQVGSATPRGARDVQGAGRRYKPVVVMSLLGDGLHNLIDGMLIAAAYTSSIGLGLITTGAVLLHEVPQEAGEFGVLVRGGLSVNRALLLNFLSASTAILGAVVALIVGAGVNGFTEALIPITAGNFLYIAAADLIPELHHEHDRREAVGHAALLVTGVAIMLLLRLVMHEVLG